MKKRKCPACNGTGKLPVANAPDGTLGTCLICKGFKEIPDNKEEMLKCYVPDCTTMISKEELDENAAYTTDGKPHCPNHYSNE